MPLMPYIRVRSKSAGWVWAWDWAGYMGLAPEVWADSEVAFITKDEAEAIWREHARPATAGPA